VILVPGHRQSQEVKCLTVGNLDISAPTSAMTVSALVTLMPSMRLRSTPHMAGFAAEAVIALGQGLLHDPLRKVALDRVRRRAHSLKQDIGPAGCEPPSRFTDVDDVTQDQANPRAMCTIPTSVFPSAAFHLATTSPPCVSPARFATAGRLLR